MIIAKGKLLLVCKWKMTAHVSQEWDALKNRTQLSRVEIQGQ